MTTTTEAKKDQGLQVRTGIKAGGLPTNHNQPTLRVRTGIKAGGIPLNHNQPTLASPHRHQSRRPVHQPQPVRLCGSAPASKPAASGSTTASQCCGYGRPEWGWNGVGAGSSCGTVSSDEC